MDARIEHFQAKRDVFLFRVTDNAFQPLQHIARRVLRGQPASKTGERDDLFKPRICRLVDPLPKNLDAFLMLILLRKTLAPPVTGRHRANQPPFFQFRPELRRHQFHRRHFQIRRVLRQLSRRHGIVAPKAHGLANAAINNISKAMQASRAQNRGPCGQLFKHVAPIEMRKF